MARLSILDRFRPVGAPGAAGLAGVPSSDVRGPAAELAPVFAALRGDLAAAKATVERANLEAAAIRAAARTEAAAIASQARLDAASARATAADGVTNAAAAADAEHLAKAAADAARVAAEAEPRIPETVQQVIDRMRADVLAAP